MNKEQQELLGEAYVNYTKALIDSITFSERGKHFKSNGLEFNSGYPNYIHYTKEEFINKCKTDKEFSEKWGLKIEERELDMMERWAIADLTPNMEEFDFANYMCDKHNVPTKLITITYKKTIIESYEQPR
jgi:hypothetical protein